MESSAQHFDHKKVEPAKIDDPRILIANNVLNDDKPHSLHSILDDFLADKNCYSQHDFFRWRKVSELTDLQIAINAIHSSAFRQAACLLLRTLIDELEKIDFSSIHEKYPKLTSLASKATEVINEVTKDSPNYFNILKVQSAFRDIAGLDEVSQECREVAAFFSSVVISLVSFAVGSVCGFLAGLARWKLGFIGGALVGALLTAINFAEKGKDMTYRNIAGNQVAQQFVTTSINTPLIS